MSDWRAEERIAQLEARAQAQRLAAQLAMLEAREQLAPLRSAYGFVSAAAGALSPNRPASGLLGSAARFGIGHPWLASAVAAAALRGARRQPLVVALATGVGLAAWWLLRAPSTGAETDESAE